MKGLVIDNVIPDSIAEEMEIEAGDRLLAINGHSIRDIIDYNYFSGDDELVLEIEKPDGEVWEVEIERDVDESLGLMFPPPQPHRCGNRCVFCFVHQLPRGLRRPLYVKDEDYRLSFLYGNYVTLANIRQGDVKRIIGQRLSPLYISVHTTDPLLREQMLGKAGIIPILEIMGELAEAGITMHAQVVLCPGINDGPSLERTVNDLVALHPHVASLAIVPVGLTRHRRGLPPLQPVTSPYAREFVERWEQRGRQLAGDLGEPFLFLADEFYLKGGVPFPPLKEYGDLPQVENGVGMVPLFMEEAREVLESAGRLPPVKASVVTGVSASPFLVDFLRDLSAVTGSDIDCVAVANVLFGESVTVTGLIAGRDIIAGLLGKETGDIVIIPDVMLKEGEGIFLDDLTVEDLHVAVGREVVVAESTPWGIYRVLVEHSRSR